MRDDSQTPLGFIYREIVNLGANLKRIADILDAATKDGLAAKFRDTLQRIAAEERAASVELDSLVGMGAGSAAYADRAMRALRTIRQLIEALDGGSDTS